MRTVTKVGCIASSSGRAARLSYNMSEKGITDTLLSSQAMRGRQAVKVLVGRHRLPLVLIFSAPGLRSIEQFWDGLECLISFEARNIFVAN